MSTGSGRADYDDRANALIRLGSQVDSLRNNFDSSSEGFARDIQYLKRQLRPPSYVGPAPGTSSPGDQQGEGPAVDARGTGGLASLATERRAIPSSMSSVHQPPTMLSPPGHVSERSGGGRTSNSPFVVTGGLRITNQFPPRYDDAAGARPPSHRPPPPPSSSSETRRSGQPRENVTTRPAGIPSSTASGTSRGTEATTQAPQSSDTSTRPER